MSVSLNPFLCLSKPPLPSNNLRHSHGGAASKPPYTPKKHPDQNPHTPKKPTINSNRRNILIGSLTLTITPISGHPPPPAHAAPQTSLLPRKLDSTIRTRVPRARISRSKKQKEEEEEVLNVNMELLDIDKYIKFDVFVNEEDDFPAKNKVMNWEYAGSFVSLPGGNNNIKKEKGDLLKRKLTVGLSDLIEELGVDGDQSVEVVLVPRSGSGSVVITDVNIDYVSS